MGFSGVDQPQLQKLTAKVAKESRKDRKEERRITTETLSHGENFLKSIFSVAL
jgi:hypothetical protein